MYPKRYRLHVVVALVVAVLVALSWSAPGSVSAMGKSEPTGLVQPGTSNSKAHQEPDRNRPAAASHHRLQIPDQVVIGILWLLSTY
jgi:hypothetical protein